MLHNYKEIHKKKRTLDAVPERLTLKLSHRTAPLLLPFVGVFVLQTLSELMSLFRGY
jgi:hypothetical protein